MTRTLAHFRRDLVARLPAPLGYAVFVLRRLRDDRCLETAGSLTFTTLVALVPFISIALMVVSAFSTFAPIAARFRTFLLSNLVPDAAGRVGLYMRQFAENADRLTLMGVLALGITALAMMFTIDRTFNRIWRVQRQRPLVIKTLTYWALLTLGPILTGLSLMLTTSLASIVGQGGAVQLLLGGGSYALSVIGFALLYWVVPNCPVPGRHALIAGAFTATVFELMKHLFGWYVKQFGAYKLVYGAFASVPIFLLWLYLVWVVVLTGAVLSATLSYWHGGAWRKRLHPGQALHDAVRLLLRLEDARLAGETPTLGALRKQLALGQDALHALLERLAAQGWVQPTREGGWVLSTALDRITLRALYHLLVTQPISRGPTAVDQRLAARFAQIDGILEVSLADLRREPADTLSGLPTHPPVGAG
jgi:membrane protein